MDPNVQVALVSVFATLITTSGVVAVAMINNRKERDKAAGEGVDAALDDKDILGSMLALMSDVQRKEAIIVELKKKVRDLTAEIKRLREQLNQPEEAP